DRLTVESDDQGSVRHRAQAGERSGYALYIIQNLPHLHGILSSDAEDDARLPLAEPHGVSALPRRLHLHRCAPLTMKNAFRQRDGETAVGDVVRTLYDAGAD